MPAVHGVTGLRDQVQRWRLAGERIALVPTMGNLHAGHLKLVEEAHRHATRAVVSIFVNPLQFGPGEDYQSYPRTLEADQAKLQAVRADLLFAPAVEEMYPGGRDQVTRVEVPGLSAILDGEFRPGHFSGVATVVLKLLNIVQPDVALFGEKDYQQLLIVRRLVTDLSLPVEIVGVPIMREADGLAMSSRNQYLTPAERQQAPLLYRTLGETAAALRNGRRDFSRLEAEAMQKLSAQLRPDYVSIRAAHTLAAADTNTRDFVVLAAVWLGKARLIDNIQVTANESRRGPPLPQNS
ncbi:MAG: pantoate--beta-alanine ligase [Gammaproteobacteria bacterium]|nr:pantoate--beta-alanine ligase [Gammaproteobacteria bacterium]